MRSQHFHHSWVKYCNQKSSQYVSTNSTLNKTELSKFKSINLKKSKFQVKFLRVRLSAPFPFSQPASSLPAILLLYTPLSLTWWILIDIEIKLFMIMINWLKEYYNKSSSLQRSRMGLGSYISQVDVSSKNRTKIEDC